MRKNNLLNFGLPLFIGLFLVQGAWAETDAGNASGVTGASYEFGEGVKVKTAGDEVNLTLNLFNKLKLDAVNRDKEVNPWNTKTRIQIPQSRLIVDSNFVGGLFNFYGEMDIFGVPDREIYRTKSFVPQEVTLSVTPVENISFIAGQWTTPFGREGYDYDEFKYNMESDSIAGGYSGYLPELGLGVETNIAGYNLVFGIFNGRNISDRKYELKTDYKLAALLSKNIFGEYDRSISSDINYSQEAAMNVGVFAAYDKGKDKESDFTFKDRRIGADIGYKHLGYSAEAEVFYSNVIISDDGESFATLGATAKAGSFFIPKYLEGVARLSWLKYRHFDASYSIEPAIGANYYIMGQNVRVGSMLSYVNTKYRGGEDTTHDWRWLTSLVVLL